MGAAGLMGARLGFGVDDLGDVAEGLHLFESWLLTDTIQSIGALQRLLTYSLLPQKQTAIRIRV